MSLRRWVVRWWAGGAGFMGAVASATLWPTEMVMRGVVRARNFAYDREWLAAKRVGIPVLSVGNIAIGGAGKTPVSAWLAALLQGRGHRPAIGLRGYGEDEVLLHREINPQIPVFRAKRRAEAALEAREAGCDVVVLDDAFQHRALARDLDLVLVAVEGWSPSPRLLPRGPWREDLSALGRADAVILTRKSAPAERADAVARELARLHPGKPVVRVALLPRRLAPLQPGAPALGTDALSGRSVLAVAALAEPGPFLEHLGAAGAAVEADLYPDHHSFSPDEARRIAARAAGRMVVTTHKDAVKLRSILPSEAEAYVLEQSVRVEAGARILDVALREALGRVRG